MSDAKQKVSVWVEKDHISRAKDAGYTSPTTAINKGLELLIESITEDLQRTYSGRTEDDIGHMEDEAEDNVGHAVDVTENAVLRARLEELEKHNGTLKKELEISQETHRNYMMQVQTLINQKAIEAPGNKKPWYKFW